ncbi:MAG: adenosine kinase [Actinomycetota bacterium]
MQSERVDVVGVGNAMVDVITHASDDFVLAQGMEKGAMNLIDADRGHELYGLIDDGLEASGGSAANTMAGVASFGGSASYIGKVSDDELGKVFIDDMRSIGVGFDVAPAAEGPATGRCLIFVTPDAQRTLNTFLGVSSFLAPDDVSPSTVEAGSVLFCEGYLWDTPSAKDAIRRAMEVARAAGRKVALTVSDSFCVERHHAEFLELIDGPVDIVFANEEELKALYGVEHAAAVEIVRTKVELACLTMGKHGSLLVTADETVEIAAEEIAPVVDTTGAGDQYAAGVLYGLAKGLPLPEVGRLGSLAAAEVISHVGPRPLRPLSEFL